MMELTRLMDAYRGNEDKLRQRVALSNDLLELMAYEQLTREKKRLMAAQQAQSGPSGPMPTIRDQKEQEAFELTKQELSQQIGKTLQQKEAERRQAMSRGLAAAPGSQNVMPPQAMAAGGIVAFNGEQESYIQAVTTPPVEETPDATKEQLKQMTLPELQEYNRTRQIPERLRPGAVQQSRAQAGPVISPSRDFEDYISSAGKPEVRTEREPDIRQEAQAPKAGPEVATGIASALRSAQPSDDIQTRLGTEARVSQLLARQGRDSPALQELTGLQQAITKHAEDFPRTPEAVKQARAADLAKIEQQYARMMDPEAQKLKALSSFLLGGANRRGIGSVMSGAGAAAAQTQAMQEAQGLQALKDMQAQREAMRGAELAEAQSVYGAKGAALGSRANILSTAAKIQTELDIQDSRAATAMADAAIKAYASYSGDMAKVKAEIAKTAADLGYRLNKDDLDRATNIMVAQIQAGGRSTRGMEESLNKLITDRSRELTRLEQEVNDEKRDNPLLASALRKAPEARSAAEKNLVKQFDDRYAQRRNEIAMFGTRINEIRRQLGLPEESVSGPPRSAADQGVKVTSATAPR